MRSTLFTITGILACVLLLVYGCRFLQSAGGHRSPEELVQVALEAPDASEQEAAAAELAQLGEPARDQLRHVLAESRSPGVRAAVIQGLGKLWDYESMPSLLDAMEDPSAVVRGRAAVVVERMMSVDCGFRAADPPEARAKVVEELREQWENFRTSPIFAKWKKRLQEEKP